VVTSISCRMRFSPTRFDQTTLVIQGHGQTSLSRAIEPESWIQAEGTVRLLTLTLSPTISGSKDRTRTGPCQAETCVLKTSCRTGR
jgi:hypothetical protein